MATVLSAAFARPATRAVLWRRGCELGWVMSSKAVLLGANGALQLLLAQRLDMATYGLLVTVIGAQLFLSRILLLGVDTGMLRLRTVPDLRERSEEVALAGLAAVGWTSGLLVLAALAAGPLLRALGLAMPGWALAATVAGAIGTALVDYAYYYRLALLDYRSAGLVQSGTAAGRFLLASAAALVAVAYPAGVFFAYAGASLASGLLLVRAKLRRAVARPAASLVRRLLSFSAWQGGADVAAVLHMHQGTFLLMLLGLREAAALFGLALTLSLGFFAVSQAFSQYIAPHMMRLESPERLPAFLVRAGAAALAVAGACVPVALAIGAVLPRFLRPEFRGLAPVFYWLAAGMLLSILQSSLTAACVYLLKPSFPVIALLIRIGATGAFGLLLAPSRGAMGAAMAQFCGTAASLVAVAALAALAMRRAGAGTAWAEARAA